MTVKVSPKYQVVIPEDVRTALEIKPGMRVDVIAKGGIAYLVPVPELKDLKANMKGLTLQGIRDKRDR
jgi:AbrB family looped-hinge helix DNA binding protein